MVLEVLAHPRCAVLGRCKTLALGLGVSLSLQATSVASRWLPRRRHDLHKSHATTLVTMLVALALAVVGSAAGLVTAVVAAVVVVRGTERWRVNAI